MAPLGSVLVDRNIHKLMDEPRPCIVADRADIRPCSLDLRVGTRIWQVAGIPSHAHGFSFQKFLNSYTLNDFEFAAGKLTLTPGNVYLTELNAEFRLPKSVHGYINPKSSAGRIDLQCIVIAEGGTEFNMVPAGYEGRLYLLMIPQSFSVSDVCGQDFVQLRLFDGERRPLYGHELEMLDDKYGLTKGSRTQVTDEGVIIHLDLKNYSPANLIALKSGKPISVTARDLNPKYYFYEKGLDSEGNLWLEPNEFLLAGTVEQVRVPPHVCVEMLPYREQHGEFKSHYAGFFDPGFGYGQNGEADAATAVCEIRNISTSRIMLSHGQAVAMFRYEYVREAVEIVYGGQATKPSSYQSQTGVKLSKFFRPWASQVPAR